jgi:hypothetical protein
MNPKIVEAERGKYRVRTVGNKVIVEAKKDDSPYYVPQSIFIEGINDLKDLFVTIASVLNQIYGTDQFN